MQVSGLDVGGGVGREAGLVCDVGVVFAHEGAGIGEGPFFY